MRKYWDIIIIGGGIAGFSAAKTLRELSPSTTLLLMNGEDRIPYKRTKISKSIDSGFETNQFQLQSEKWYQDQQIELLTGITATSIEPESHSITLENGEQYGWRKLILATGAHPVLPEQITHGEDGVHVIRSAKEVELLMQDAQDVDTVVVVGMGVLGVEAAEQFRRMHKHVILVGNSVSLMPYQLNGFTADHLRVCCKQEGIELVFQEKVASLSRHAHQFFEVVLQRNKVRADMVVFCIGVIPNIELAQKAGLDVGCGILVNEYLQTFHPDIFAAGDVVEHPEGKMTGLWHAAEYQGKLAGQNALGHAVPNDTLPFRLKCEVFGQYFFSIDKPADSELSQYTVVENRDGNVYQCFYYQQNILKSVIMLNDKDRAKLYEKAVREGWQKSQVEQTFL